MIGRSLWRDWRSGAWRSDGRDRSRLDCAGIVVQIGDVGRVGARRGSLVERKRCWRLRGREVEVGTIGERVGRRD